MKSNISSTQYISNATAYIVNSKRIYIDAKYNFAIWEVDFMKLIVAIINNDDANTVMSNLTKAGYSATKLTTSGGFLRAGNITLLIGVEKNKVDDVINIIGEYSSQRKKITPVNTTYIGESMLSSMPVEVTVGGATIFVLDVEQFYKI
jgi:uncharacterized protein YaaQ